MKKKLVCLIAVLFFLSSHYSCVLAKSKSSNSMINVAIKKYKKGNYTGCLQDCQNIVQRKPSSLAYYYMAISYAQAGKKDKAIEAYSKSLSLHPNAIISNYATTGKKCLETPEQCNMEQAAQNSEIDKFVTSNPADGLSPAVRKEIQQKYLNSIKNDINGGKELDDYNFRKLNDSSIQDSPVQKENNIAQKNPSETDIEAALKVLSEASAPYTQEDNAQVHNAEFAQLNALLGGNAPTSKNNNYNMLNMLPFMIAQNKNGKCNLDPQVIQTVIMSSLMTDLNYNTDKNR